MKDKIILLFALLLFVPHGTASISFIDPTPANNSVNTTGWVFVNTSVTNEPVNSTALLNWNNSLVGWWRMNEAAGGTVVQDFSGNGNNGTWSGNTTSNVTTGRFGNGLLFDGVNDVVTVGNYQSLKMNAEFTIEAWVNLTTGKVVDSLVSKGQIGLNYGYWFAFSNLVPVLYIGNGTGYTSKAFGAALTTGVYHHVVFTFNRGNASFYRDGLLISSQTYNENNISHDSTNFVIGKFSGGSTNYFNGSIDEVRVYSRALTFDEINASYNASFRLYNNFTSLSDGVIYNFTAFTQDTTGGINSTETRFVTVDYRGLLNYTGNVSYVRYETTNNSDLIFVSNSSGIQTYIFGIPLQYQPVNNIRISNNGYVTVNMINGTKYNISGWDIDINNNTGNLTINGDLESVSDNYIIIDYLPSLEVVQTGIYGGAATDWTENGVNYLINSSLDYFWYQVTGNPAAKAIWAKNLTQANKFVILRTYWWVNTTGGLNNANWTDLDNNNTLLNYAIGDVENSIVTTGANNISGITIGEEEPNSGYDYGPINQTAYVNAANKMYNQIKLDYPSLKIYQGTTVTALSSSNLSSLKRDGFMTAYYWINMSPLFDIMKSEQNSGNDSYSYIWDASNFGSSYQHLTPEGAINSSEKAVNNYSLLRIGFFHFNESYRIITTDPSELFTKWDYNPSDPVYNSSLLYKIALLRIVGIYSMNNISGLYTNISTIVYPNNNITYSDKIISSYRFVNMSLVSLSPITVNISIYNSTIINFTATNSTAGQTMNVSIYNYTFPVTNGFLYSIKKNNVVQQAVIASGDSVSFTNIAVGSDYEIALGGISSITIPANSWGMFNNWSANLTFSQITANESNDVAYTWYNVTSGDWEDLYVGQTFNQNNIIPYWSSVLGYFNAQTTITTTVVTPSNTGLMTGWNMLYVEGGTNRTLSEIQTNIALSCTVNDLYKWNTTTADYDNTGTSVVQPNEGFIVDVAGNCNWIRTTI